MYGGAVQPLVKYLFYPEMADMAVPVLSNLADTQEGKKAIAEDGSGIPGLIHVVKKGTGMGKEKAAGVLWKLSPIYKKTIMHKGATGPLVRLSRSGSVKAKEMVTFGRS